MTEKHHARLKVTSLNVFKGPAEEDIENGGGLSEEGRWGEEESWVEWSNRYHL